ncbi:Histone deacetylase complex subunit [Coemansia sp. RSA 1722]|nr:Histone deacetylase complex subunit [Coemansia sp. RSA 485]KAJ2600699.1 Histone deacetylase complex subunit [Coemansia sp. RSA 1722]
MLNIPAIRGQQQGQRREDATEVKGSRGSGGSASGQQQQQQQRQDHEGSGSDNEAKQNNNSNNDGAAGDKDDLASNNSDNAGDEKDGGQKQQGDEDGDGDGDGEEEEEDDDDEDDDDDDDDDDEDDGVVRCVCGERNDGELMIQCEICQVWQHTLCMGIRDESHIPDKYYCEKCRPEDHPYINSRPRTVVLAEASMMGTSTMMRRSAVMAVAKMSAREEYRAASAAAAIAASVTAAATGISLPNGSNANGKKTPKKQAKKSDASVTGNSSTSTPKPSRNGRRSRRSTRGGADNDDADVSEDEYLYGSKSNNDSSANSSAPTSGNHANRNAAAEGRSSSAKPSQSNSRKNQTPKRSGGSATAIAGSAGQTNGSHKRRRVTMPGNILRGGAADGTSRLDSDDDNDDDADDDDGEDATDKEDDGSGEGTAPGEFAHDLASRMLHVKQERKKKGKNSRTPQSRMRSVSSVVKDAAHHGSDAFDVMESLKSPRRRVAGGNKPVGDFDIDGSDARRGRSEPGSPQRLSPSPSLHSLLYGNMVPGDGVSDASGSTTNKPDKQSKRKRGGTAARGGKQQRMTVSATNSPFIGDNNGFNTFGDQGILSFQQQRIRAASSAGIVRANKDAGDSGDDSNRGKNENDQSADEKSDSQGAHRQPKHNFPPRETEDVDGKKIVVPSHMLNSHGQPMYSSVTAETMCKIRYPHSKASLYDLSRRAKQLLEWLGKTQSEYELERLTWLAPPVLENSAEQNDCAEPQTEDAGVALSFDGVRVEKRSNTNQISEAPTSPISASDWPADDIAVDGSKPETQEEGSDTKPVHPRSTQSIMEDLVWRLIRFQETYSN